MENSILKLSIDEFSLKYELVDKRDGEVFMSVNRMIIDDYPELKAFMEKFKE